MILTQESNITFATFGVERGIQVLKETGFDAIDMSLFGMSSDPDFIFSTDDWKENAFKVRRWSDEAGIPFRQCHAPYRFSAEMRANYDTEVIPRIARAIEVAGILGAKMIVVHPRKLPGYQDPAVAEECFKLNMDFYKTLIPHAKEAGVKIALENMWYRDAKRGYILASACGTAADFCKYIDALDSEHIGAVLDLGHCSLVGEEAQDAIRILGHDRVTGLHIHDNDYRSDDHTIPGLGKMDWNEITKALGEIDYTGDFTYEADTFLETLAAPFRYSALKFMAEIGRQLISDIDKARTL